MNVSRWVDDRLASLDASGWRPNAARALAQLRQLERRRRRRRAGVLWGSLAAVAAALALMVVSSPQACATPTGCADHVWHTVFPRHDAAPAANQVVASAPAIPEPKPVEPVQIAQAKPAPKKNPAPPAPAAITNFKEQGSPSATVTIEIFTDYECPTCAMLYRDFMPTLMAEYVKTGKIKVLHRDFPLPQHLYSKQAARYANAAGRLGYYDAAVYQIFKTQEKWSTNGDLDAQLTEVLPPGVMQKVRDAVKNDKTLDESVDVDMAMVRSNGINQTPTLVVVSKKGRDPVVGIPRWDLFKGYLDKLTAR